MTDPPQLASGERATPWSRPDADPIADAANVLTGLRNADKPLPVPPWLTCPNTPPCPHPGLLHDINDHDDPSPTCCAGDCTCGHTP